MIEVRDGLIIAGKYRLIQRLARGGMGSVWSAQHVTLGVPVAVKFMAPSYAQDRQFRARFEREAKAAAQLRSPNVVQILDYGVEQTMPYLVMELLNGEDLGERLAREHRLSVRDALPILAQIGKALRRAHEEGIVHRDLKPANVFLVRQDDELLVKVLDFGIAKWLRPDAVGEATKTGHVMGSPSYMSPEQIRGVKEVDQRTDLWALGVIVYRMLTGHLPFVGVQPVDIGVKIWTERPIMPTRHAPDLDPQVDAFITKALSVDIEQRFQTIKEMLDALAQLPACRSIPPTLVTLDADVPERTTEPYRPKVGPQLAAWPGPHPEKPTTTTKVLPDKRQDLAPELPTDASTEQPFPQNVEPLATQPFRGIERAKKRRTVIVAVVSFVALLGFLGLMGFYEMNPAPDKTAVTDLPGPLLEAPGEFNTNIPAQVIADENSRNGSPAPSSSTAPSRESKKGGERTSTRPNSSAIPRLTPSVPVSGRPKRGTHEPFVLDD